MKIRMIEDFGGFKKGEQHYLRSEQAKDLISNGYAIIVRETATDKLAEDALLAAKQRDHSK